MLKATWDWYYGSSDEELLADCQFGETFEKRHDKEESDLIVRPGTFGDGVKVNVFTMVRRKQKEMSHLEICAKHLKLLRHPNILRFISCAPMDLEVHLVTEHAYPLNTILKHVDAHEICSGLHDIALALQFIHEKAFVSHNNVCMESIYAKDSGPWKLSGFDYACRFDEATESHLKQNQKYMEPPEEKGQNKVTLPLKNTHGHCRDVYSFGLLLEEFLEKVQFAARLPKKVLEEIIEDITREDYENRPTLKEILTMPIFKSAYISIVNFLQSVTLRSKSDKQIFFRSLLAEIAANHIFPEVVGRRLVPLLLTPIILAEQCAVNHVVKEILTPIIEHPASSYEGGIIPESVFARYVIPKIVELFKCRLIHVRLVLIDNFSKYVHLFEKSVLNEEVLPEVLLGLHDANNQLVQGSLHALADAVTIVGGDVIVGTEREKIFSPGIPKFDGRALNESQAIAYEAKIPTRKKVEKKPPTSDKPKKLTLLELAMRKSQSSPNQSTDVALKQKQFAHALEQAKATSNGYSDVGIRNGLAGHTIRPKKKDRHTVTYVKPTPQVKTDIEMWASSDDDEDDDQSDDLKWPDFEEDAPLHTNQSNHQTHQLNNARAPKKAQKTATKPSISPKTKTSTRYKQPGNAADTNTQLPIEKDSPVRSKLGREFEISVQQSTSVLPLSEPDFFADMAPQITPTSSGMSRLNSVKSPMASSTSSTISSAFNAPKDDDDEDGWDDDDLAWE